MDYVLDETNKMNDSNQIMGPGVGPVTRADTRSWVPMIQLYFLLAQITL